MGKILYVQVGVGFLHVNRKLIGELKKHFPDAEIELYDVLAPVKRNPLILAWNSMLVVGAYWRDFISGRKNIRNFKYHFLGTTFIFRHFSKLARKKIHSARWEFVIQTQSLCDCSGNGVNNYIYTDHTNLNNLNYKWTSPHKYLRTRAFIDLERKAFHNATLIFVMSENIRDSLINQYGVSPEQIRVAYVGSNTTPPASHNAGKYLNKNIIFVGKDWFRKGGPLLVKAFEKVQQVIPEATLSIVGCRPKINLKNCRVYGEVSLDEVAKHYSEATVFCFPTLREPFGVVFIEAMLNRLPIVTNRMGAAPYLVTETNGYLIDHDADRYSEVLVTLLNDADKCRQYGEESYRIASELYTWQNVAKIIATNINSKERMTTLAPQEETENTFTRDEVYPATGTVS
jgi:glycosyltransferase involved in cell wall biosynthesis